jgi:hypothetical protein
MQGGLAPLGVGRSTDRGLAVPELQGLAGVSNGSNELTELTSILNRATEKARADERRRLGLWLEQQAKIAREAESGVHPEAATRTHTAVLIWAAARVLAEDF